jgi:hypothetical protein
MRRRIKKRVLVLSLLMLAQLPPSVASSQGRSHEIESLKREIEELKRQNAENEKKLELLERRIEELSRPAPEEAPGSASAALDRAVEALGAAQTQATQGDLWSRPLGPGQIRLIDVSLDVLSAAGSSTAREPQLRDLQGGGHDPNRRGFTLQQAELSLTGAVDPYLTGEAHMIWTPDVLELEEAFFTTQALPWGLQLEGGHFFTEFGLINPLHPHAWHWIDQPIMNTRLFGADGLRAPGARLGWLIPLPWFSELHLGLQNANEGETTSSFLAGEGVGGRPAVRRDVRNLGDLLYLARWNSSWDLTSDLTALVGFSGLHGPNSTGEDGETWIYGGDLKVRWRPASHFRGWPFLLWQSEVTKRDYTADFFLAGQDVEPGNGDGHSHGDEGEEEEELPEEDIPGTILRDWGFYSQLLYGFRYGWAAGVRYEYATGRNESLGGRNADPFRDDRHRVSPLLTYQPTEYSRFRLQYNYDHAQHLDEHDAHSVWLGGEILYGKHPAHVY